MYLNAVILNPDLGHKTKDRAMVIIGFPKAMIFTSKQGRKGLNPLDCFVTQRGKLRLVFGGHDAGYDEPETQEGAPKPDSPKPKAPTLEEVRGVLADKASDGHREAVQALLQKHGAKRLSDIAPVEFGALIAEARAIQ